MDFVAGGAGLNVGGVGENGPILYSEPNRTSAIDDLRSVVIYVFIVTIFLAFFLILPGIRNDKFPTFLCITSSLLVTSIILLALFGTTWHHGEAPISAAYKAFSRDRIQGELSVRIGLHSVNITLRAQKYYILHETDGPIIMDNTGPPVSMGGGLAALVAASMRPATTTYSASGGSSPAAGRSQASGHSGPAAAAPAAVAGAADSGEAARFLEPAGGKSGEGQPARGLAEELLEASGAGGRVAEDADADPEEEVFGGEQADDGRRGARRRRRSGAGNVAAAAKRPRNSDNSSLPLKPTEGQLWRQQRRASSPGSSAAAAAKKRDKYTIKRVNIDINYNEQFYWIEPNQMRQEYHNALERGLPYPILTVVEYLSQDEAGFNWSRQYRSAGYYSSILLWLSLSLCVLMFFLHCAAPKYGIYTMQVLGLLLLGTNLTYATLVPKGDQKLVIPFEGQSLTFRFGWSYWLVLLGGCLSLSVGTIIVIIDKLFPNFIFTTVLDVDYDSHNRYYRRRNKLSRKERGSGGSDANLAIANSNSYHKPEAPPFYREASKDSAGGPSLSHRNEAFEGEEEAGTGLGPSDGIRARRSLTNGHSASAQPSKQEPNKQAPNLALKSTNQLFHATDSGTNKAGQTEARSHSKAPQTIGKPKWPSEEQHKRAATAGGEDEAHVADLKGGRSSPPTRGQGLTDQAANQQVVHRL